MLSNLRLRSTSEGSVYRYIYDWEAIPSGHGAEIYYLLIHAQVQWGKQRERQEDVFAVAMQYSPVPGRGVAITQPAHILEKDLDVFVQRWQAFVDRRKGQR